MTSAHGEGNLILDTLSEGIIARDMQHRIIFPNKAAEAITGYSRHKVVGRDCHDAFLGNSCGTKCPRAPHELTTSRGRGAYPMLATVTCVNKETTDSC